VSSASTAATTAASSVAGDRDPDSAALSIAEGLDEPTPLELAPLWARSFSCLVLFILLAAVLFVTNAYFSIYVANFAEIYMIALAACLSLTLLALLLVSAGLPAAVEAMRTLLHTGTGSGASDPNASHAIASESTGPSFSSTTIVLCLPLIAILGALCWAVILTPFWFISYLFEGLAGWPWWASLIIDLVYLMGAILLFSWWNERMVQVHGRRIAARHLCGPS
jgi:hypothetical protein